MNKPANLIIEETRESLIKTINESSLPAYLLEPIIKDLYNQINLLKQKELKQSQEQYERDLKQEKEVNNKESNT